MPMLMLALEEHLYIFSQIALSTVKIKVMDLDSLLMYVQATQGLQIRVEKIRDIFSGGIKSLVELATEFSGNSKTALGGINSEVVEHSSALAEVSKPIHILEQIKAVMASNLFKFLDVNVSMNYVTMYSL